MAEEFPKQTIELIKNSLTKYGIKNPILQSGILAVVSTEGSFYPRNELSYGGTKPPRLRILFGDRLKDLTDAQIEKLSKNNEAFYNKIYGGVFGKVNLGNSQDGDGYKFRGRGFNGITGRALYTLIGKQIGVDLVNNPELLNTLPVASDALAVYFGNAFKSGFSTGLLQKKFPTVTEVNAIDSLPVATKVAFQANAGWKTNLENPALKAEHEKQLKNVIELNKILLAFNPLTTVASTVYYATEIFTNPKKKSYATKY